MDNLGFNKIAGAVLATGLAIFGLREISNIVFEPHELEKPGYKIEVAEAAGEGGAVADVPPDWGTVLPAANVTAGEEVSKKCASCHTFTPGGPNGTGPNLYGVIGRKPGSHPGFAYSAAMSGESAKVPTWDYEHIYEFVKSPQAYIPGTKMTFVGLKKPEDRINLIAYLRTLSPSPPPIPAPNPAAAAAPASGAAADSDTPAESAAPAASGQPVVVGSGGSASNVAGQAGAPKAGAAAAPTQTRPGPGNAPG